MTGIELVAGFLLMWAARKARRVAAGLDKEVDNAIDAGLAKLHDVVTAKMGSDSSLAQLEREGREGVENSRTIQRVNLAIEEAAETDQKFAEEVAEAIEALQRTEGVDLGQFSTALQAGRDIKVTATRRGVAAVNIHGPVLTGNPPTPGATG